MLWNQCHFSCSTSDFTALSERQSSDVDGKARLPTKDEQKGFSFVSRVLNVAFVPDIEATEKMPVALHHFIIFKELQ